MSGAANASRRDPDVITMRGHVSENDKAASDYCYLPFVVPPGTGRINVHYDYGRTSMAAARAGAENTLDIGIFAPGSGATEPGEFRGWSGGARTGFLLSAQNATPGYLAGPLPAGTWHVILGLYRIAPEGCDYTVTVTLAAGDGSGGLADTAASTPTTPASPERAPRPLAGESRGAAGRWYTGDLQSHTCHSDAKASPSELARVARHRGLQFLAVTDHNTTSHLNELPGLSTSEFLLIPAMEITTYYGHANVWGLSGWVDFRCRNSSDIKKRVDAARAQGALVSVNHPYSDCPWTFGWVDGIHAIEVWQGLWNRGNLEAVAWWDRLLCEGRRVTGVGGSDRHQPQDYDPHFPHQVGTPATRVRASGLSTEEILQGIRTGRATVAESPHGPWLDMTVRRDAGATAEMGDALHVRPGEELTVECRITGGGDDTMELVSGGAVIARHACERGAERATLRVKVTWEI